MTPAVSLAAALAGPLAAVRVDFDATMFYAAALFALLIVVLNQVLFEPLLKLFALRERRIDGAKADARELDEKAGKLLRKIERRLGKVTEVATVERDRMRADTLRLETEILAEARLVTERIEAEGRQRIEQEIVALRRELELGSGRLAKEIADSVLGRDAS